MTIKITTYTLALKIYKVGAYKTNSYKGIKTHVASHIQGAVASYNFEIPYIAIYSYSYYFTQSGKLKLSIHIAMYCHQEYFSIS